MLRRIALVSIGVASVLGYAWAAPRRPAPLASDPPLGVDRPGDVPLATSAVELHGAAERADGGPLTRFFEYGAVIDRVTGMVNDDRLIQRASARGLDVLDVTWEDTGRSMGSSIGPNISDLTLQVRRESPWTKGAFVTSRMPVLRFPNFTDKTADIKAENFFVRVGNEKDGGELRSVPLATLLEHVTEYASAPKSIKGSGNLLAKRDTHFLVSAQAVFLPIPKQGKAEFQPVLYNYQSAPGSPADLAILVTRQGTSVQVIENKPEEVTETGWGQELYFNNRGQRAAFTAERRSEVVARIEAQGGPKTDDDRTAISKGADVIFLIQVPLKHKNEGRLGGIGYGFGSGIAYAASGDLWGSSLADAYGAGGLGLSGTGSGGGGYASPAKASAAPAPSLGLPSEARAAPSDVERAVVGHGPNLGPFSEGHDLELVRDPAFPVRVTVQLYKATSNGVVSESDLASIRQSIADVYSHADFVGSLVVPEDDGARPTAWQKASPKWFPW